MISGLPHHFPGRAIMFSCFCKVFRFLCVPSVLQTAQVNCWDYFRIVHYFSGLESSFLCFCTVFYLVGAFAPFLKQLTWFVEIMLRCSRCFMLWECFAMFLQSLLFSCPSFPFFIQIMWIVEIISGYSAKFQITWNASNTIGSRNTHPQICEFYGNDPLESRISN